MGGKAPPNVYVKLETEITVIIVWRVYFIKARFFWSFIGFLNLDALVLGFL